MDTHICIWKTFGLHLPHGEGVARGLNSGGEGDGELSRHLLGRVTDPARHNGAIKLYFYRPGRQELSHTICTSDVQ